MRGRATLLPLALSLAACEPPPADLVFVEGRAVAPAGDTLLALTRSGLRGLIVRDRRSHATDTIGAAALLSPFHVQHHDGRWFVSDVDGGRSVIVELSFTGEPVRRLDVDAIAWAPHQFAVLPDGRIVLETATGELVALADGTRDTFAIVESGVRPGLLLAAQGGVLHAAPGRALTLYNERGNIRWRLAWPWREAAFVSDLAVDAHGRMHVIAGEEAREGFVVFSLSPMTGEVVRWSDFEPDATFVVDRLGNIRPERQ